MHIHKKIGAIALSLLSLCALTLGGCGENEVRSIQSIQKTASNGLTDTYTVYYTDGTTDTFEITNGANGQNGTNGLNGTNGEDGKDVTVSELYEAYVAEYGEISYEDFLAAYMTFTVDDSAAINRCLQSNAKVYTEFTETVYSGYRPGSTTTQTVQYVGSAVIYEIDSEYTYFLTNYHVVYDADAQTKLSDTIHCYLYGSEDYPVKNGDAYDYGEYAIACEYVNGSVTYDIAVLRASTEAVRAINPNACAVELAESYHVGETAIAIGNPDDAGISVTKGIVSVDNDFIQLSLDGTTREYRSIRIDTPLYSGNSGGGLFNKDGKLIGINNAGNTEEQNINYAIPLQVVKGVTENILYHANDNDARQTAYGRSWWAST